MTNEEYLRSQWECVTIHPNGVTEMGDNLQTVATRHSAAHGADFTRERKEEVARLDAEINLASLDVAACHEYEWSNDLPLRQRILQRLQLIRTELTRGMKEGA